MSLIRFSKTRRQDFRSSFLSDTASKPIATGLDHLEAIQKEEAATHDKWVSDLSPETLVAIWKDLAAKPCWDRSNPIHRWTMGRRAAVGRRINALHLAF